MRQQQKKRAYTDILNEWCAWKETQPELSEEDFELVRAIRNVVSQVGTWKAKFEKAEADRRFGQPHFGHSDETDPNQQELPLD